MHRQPSKSLAAVALLGIQGMYQLFCSKGTVIAGSFDARQEWLNPGRLRESGRYSFKLGLN